MADREDVNILRDQIDALKESFGIKSKITENDRTQIGVAKQLARFAEQQVDNKSKQLLTERSIADIQDDISQAKILQDKIEAKIGTKNTVKNRLLKEFSDLNTKITDDLEAQREAAENLEKSVGGIGIIIKAINKIPFIKDLVNSEKEIFESAERQWDCQKIASENNLAPKIIMKGILYGLIFTIMERIEDYKIDKIIGKENLNFAKSKKDDIIKSVQKLHDNGVIHGDILTN